MCSSPLFPWEGSSAWSSGSSGIVFYYSETHNTLLCYLNILYISVGSYTSIEMGDDDDLMDGLGRLWVRGKAGCPLMARLAVWYMSFILLSRLDLHMVTPDISE